MTKKRAFVYKALAIFLLLAIAVTMFIIGRGHMVYLDNKTMEYNGQTYKADYKVVAYVDGESVAKLYAKERGMATCMGQSFQVTLEITREKGGEPVTRRATLQLPYSMDGVVINLPTLLAGLPADAYISEFVSAIPETESAEEDVVIDEFAIPEVDSEAAPEA